MEEISVYRQKMNKHTYKVNTRNMTLIALMTSIACILGPFSLPIPISPVPISLTNLVVYMAVYVLGRNKGTISIFVYLLIGFLGLPVFSSFTGGPAKLFGPTGGYLLGFLFTAYISGVFIDKCNKRYIHFMGMAIGTSICYIFGTIWLAYQMDLTFGAALSVGVLPFILMDLVKTAIAAFIGPTVRKQLRKSGLVG